MRLFALDVSQKKSIDDVITHYFRRGYPYDDL